LYSGSPGTQALLGTRVILALVQFHNSVFTVPQTDFCILEICEQLMNKQRIEKKCGVHKYIDSNVCPAHYPVLTMWQLKDWSQIFLAYMGFGINPWNWLSYI
jgi:hypothetical protein